MSFRNRVASLQGQLEAHDVLVLYPGPNTQYVANFFGEPLDRHLLIAVPASGDPWIVTPRKSLDLIQDVSWIELVTVIEDNDPKAVATRLSESLPDSVDRLLLDDRMPVSVAHPLQEAANMTFGLAGEVLKECRIRKDTDEIAALKRSGSVADTVSEKIRAMGTRAIGMTEAELADEIRGRLHAKGGTRLSFDIVVASGPNAAQPYYRHGDRRIREGEPVILDFGAFVDEYASDQTRTTVFAGEPSDRFLSAYEAVRTALDAGIEAVEPGVEASTVDRIVSGVIADHGFEDNLIHATGHGVGLEAHEEPTIANSATQNLELGMVFSIEPGVYFEDAFGVRVEDLVVVTENGCDRLNHSPRTWRPL